MGRVCRVLITTVLMAAWLVAPPLATAQGCDGAESVAGDGLIAPARLAALKGQVRERGSVRVILGLALEPGFQPEGHLTTAERKAQRWRIHRQQAATGSRLQGFSRGVRFRTLPFLALEVTAEELAELASDPRILSIEEDVPLYPRLASSVPLIGAAPLHAVGHTGLDWAVAVIDGGMQSDHPFFNERVIHEACFDSGSGVCAETACNDDCIHGTHVAGIAAGGSDPQVTFSGVAPGANLVAIRSEFLSSSVVRALEHVAELHDAGRKIAAVNMSFGTLSYHTTACDGEYPSFSQAIRALRSRGIAPVAAAGNERGGGREDLTGDPETGIIAPACLAGVVAVGATSGAFGRDERITSFSNHNDLVDLLAPGRRIHSSIWREGTPTYDSADGTSTATPHVAGAFALLRGADESASVETLLWAMVASGVPLSRDESGTELVAKPRLQLEAALATLQEDGGPPPSSSAATDGPSEAGETSRSGGGALSPGLLLLLIVILGRAGIRPRQRLS